MDPARPTAGVPLCPVLIGRADLLALADRRLAGTRSGHGHVLFLAGEAGIGKTRLLAGIRDRASTLDIPVLGVSAYPRDVEVAGGVLADLAAELVRRPGTAEAGAALARRLEVGGGGDGDVHRQRRLLAADLAATVLSLASSGPVLLALEDLHWADDLTLEVLDRVAGALPPVPMLV